MYTLGATPAELERQAAAQEAYEQCKALEPILGPCTMPVPEHMVQQLPPLTTTAIGPWALLAVYVLALLALGQSRGGKVW